MSRPIQVKPADSESRTGNLLIPNFLLVKFIFSYLSNGSFIHWLISFISCQ